MNTLYLIAILAVVLVSTAAEDDPSESRLIKRGFLLTGPSVLGGPQVAFSSLPEYIVARATPILPYPGISPVPVLPGIPALTAVAFNSTISIIPSLPIPPLPFPPFPVPPSPFVPPFPIPQLPFVPPFPIPQLPFVPPFPIPQLPIVPPFPYSYPPVPVFPPYSPYPIVPAVNPLTGLASPILGNNVHNLAPIVPTNGLPYGAFAG